MPKHEMPEFQWVWGFRRYVPYMKCKKTYNLGVKNFAGCLSCRIYFFSRAW